MYRYYFKESIMTLTAYYQLRNTKAAGLGFELLTSEPGAFIVLEECSYEKPYEIARYGHNGSAGDRSNAFSCAMNKARSLQNYSGAKLDYNVYEETA
ncbi:hypothetical protein RA300_27730 [Klebsiella pneumoniae subsp. pneumoniae]|nr:hypothetical protein [Klebsiella pneumoniae]MDG6213840.1 hypothetical protein [Klebsiella pneumoniae]MDH7650880.1 hypothetical protein [Klebsiella pneumoniae]MDQ1783156.1 hypothetical protein [Klebsiella pneumoniae subsp. pneumoniae]MDQ1898787.1 hypothetical protein [Klebsiella pneumoniae subsp. pneumoniae]